MSQNGQPAIDPFEEGGTVFQNCQSVMHLQEYKHVRLFLYFDSTIEH